MDGTEDKPITIRREPGTERDEVILKGEADESRVLEILHSYYIIEVWRCRRQGVGPRPPIWKR